MTTVELPLTVRSAACCIGDTCAPLTRAPLSAIGAGSSVLLKALADPVRLRLVSMIAAHEGGEACVCDLTEPLGLTQPTVSYHLKMLDRRGLPHPLEAGHVGVLHARARRARQRGCAAEDGVSGPSAAESAA